MLFNETIKQNIKFGDLKATDARVLEVAIQANALAFIMQNDEDYNAPSVKIRVTENFNTCTLRLSDYPKIKSLLSLA
jgi:ABC-type multidrug transport system fused ATPase/permease subunit